ncbi:MAG: FitA-like ribbon-helix-helix domain-containing protein [Myxococcaceae bacterium]
MKQLTIRGFDRDLERELRRLAKAEGISLNQAALRLLRQGAGLGGAKPRRIGEALAKYAGTMTKGDAEAIEASIRYFDRVSLGDGE